MSDPGQELLSQLVESERAAERCADPTTSARVWQDVQARLVHGPAPVQPPDGFELMGLKTASARLLHMSLLVGGLVVAGGAVMAYLGQQPKPTAGTEVQSLAGVETREATPSSPTQAEPVPVPVPVPMLEVPVAELPDPAVATITPALQSQQPRTRRRPQHRGTSKPRPPAAKTGTVAEEIALIAAAESALRQAGAQRSLKLLREHEQRFAGGQLIQEREKIRVLALCRANRKDSARQHAQAFLKRWPTSPYASIVQQACVKD